MTHTHAEHQSGQSTEEFWETFYGERDQVWSGKPNWLLVREAESLPPGTALDLGCAEGGDAIWLAERGWQVTAVDVSATALARAARRAETAGVAEKIDWQQHNLANSFPAGTFDLVTAAYFHSPVAKRDEREQALRRAVDAVAPGGTLLIIGHAGWPTWRENPPDAHLPTVTEVLASLRLVPGQWQVEVADTIEIDLPGPEGQPGVRTDNVLRVRRTDSPQ